MTREETIKAINFFQHMKKRMGEDHLKITPKGSIAYHATLREMQFYDEAILAIERYQDLLEYFSDKDIAKTILGDREEFKKWLDRIKWNVRKVDELARKLEQAPCEDCVNLANLLKKFEDRFIELQKAHKKDMQLGVNWCINTLKDTPPVTPTHGTCKDCARKRLDKEESEEVGAEKYFCPVVGNYVDETPDFYCANFEKRGSEE